MQKELLVKACLIGGETIPEIKKLDMKWLCYSGLVCRNLTVHRVIYFRKIQYNNNVRIIKLFSLYVLLISLPLSLCMAASVYDWEYIQ